MAGPSHVAASFVQIVSVLQYAVLTYMNIATGICDRQTF